MKVGYARVSTKEQNEARQIRAFEEMGIEKVYLDKQSGKNADRPQLKEMLSFIREGDIITVESISRIARNTKDLLTIVETIAENHHSITAHRQGEVEMSECGVCGGIGTQLGSLVLLGAV